MSKRRILMSVNCSSSWLRLLAFIGFRPNFPVCLADASNKSRNASRHLCIVIATYGGNRVDWECWITVEMVVMSKVRSFARKEMLDGVFLNLSHIPTSFLIFLSRLRSWEVWWDSFKTAIALLARATCNIHDRSMWFYNIRVGMIVEVVAIRLLGSGPVESTQFKLNKPPSRMCLYIETLLPILI